MLPALALSLALLGQTQTGGSTFDGIPMLQRYEIVTDDGLEVVVEGWKLPNNGGKVTWEPNRPFNAKAVRAAQARREQARRLAAQPRPKADQPAPPKLRENPRNHTEPDGTRVLYPMVPDAVPVRPEPEPEPRGEEREQTARRAIRNFGIGSPEKFKGYRADHYTAPTGEAQRFVAEAKAQADEAGKLHLTVIGSKDECAPVVNDVNTSPAFARLRETLMVQDYRAGEWPVDPQLGFRPGKPAIIVQAAKGSGDPNGGRVIYRANDYSMGPEGLAEAIRKADPSYKPDRDPGPATGNSGTCPLGFTRDHWPIILVVGVVLFVVVTKLPQRKEG